MRLRDKKSRGAVKNTIVLIGAVIFFFFLFRWFERKQIYFPAREIEFTPEAIGLPFEDVYFNAGDGVRLNGWFIPAIDSETTLIFCHGNGGNIGDRLGSIAIFNKLGLNIFIFDYRGYGRSDGCPSEEGTYLDGRAAYDYVVGRKDIDPAGMHSNGISDDKIILYGESLGGAIAYELAAASKVSAVITLGTFSSIVDMGKTIYPFLPVALIVRIRYDVASRVDKIKIPKLFIHSFDDEIVPFEQGRKLFSLACEPREFYEMHGGHNDAIFTYESEFCERITGFLSKYDLK